MCTVQTAIRTVHVTSPLATASPAQATESSSLAPTIEITERPGLNNSTGQRLWDCAIGMTSFLSQHPSALEPDFPLEGLLTAADLDERPPAKRCRRHEPSRNKRLRVVELGAGCALASMAAPRILAADASTQQQQRASVLATDVETTVESTLKENLLANGMLRPDARSPSTKSSPNRLKTSSFSLAVESAVLDWGRLSDQQLDVVFGRLTDVGRNSDDAKASDDPALTILATDVLYNPESHPLFLSTLLSILRPRPPSSNSTSTASTATTPRRALLAYKHRTEGDDGFFALARAAGLEVTKVWEWGEVSVWALT
ncbi:hypothetical protein JCM10908_005740 [Rhodotorula pacifica]|uniref:uncharacterized protein n=1 Tax=Rhodotorula pacifica TaxID=1495444 RepID=UPI0031732474